MPRLLLIEDEIGAIAALKRMLARSGHEVLVATNLPDALSTIEQEHPDALLVAAGLQGESAASLVEAIRGIDIVRPLIVLGDGAGSGEPFLGKPVDAGKLIELLRELLPGSASAPAPEPTLHARSPALTSVGAPRSGGASEPSATLAPLAQPLGGASGGLDGAGRARGIVSGHAAGAQPSAGERSPLSNPPDAARRRELVAKTLAEAQARRQAAAAARTSTVRTTPSTAPTLPLTPTPAPETSAPWLVAREDLPYFQPPDGGAVANPRTPLAQPDPPPPTPPAAPVARTEPVLPAAHTEPPEQALATAQPPQFPRTSAEAAVPARRPSPEALEIPRSGTLDSLEPAVVVLACHRAHLTGQLQLEQGLVQRTLFFDDGRLAGAASTSPDERLEALSYRRGLISREQQRQLRAETQIPTRRLALLMVERAYLKQAELFPLVQERVEEVVYEACGAFAGAYQILAQPVPDDERVGLSRSPLALVTEAIRRKYLMDRLLAGLGGPATLLRPARGPELADYGLTARERRLAQSIDGMRNIEELLFESGSKPLPGLKVLYALTLGRTVEIALRGVQADAAPEVEARIDLTRVAEKYEQVRSANYFEVLGVSASATAYEIEQSYDRLAREFQPGRFRELRHPELLGQLDEIQRLLAEARDILADEGLREEYRAHVVRGGLAARSRD